MKLYSHISKTVLTHIIVIKVMKLNNCKKFNIDSKAKWYEDSPNGVVESNNIKILWNCVIQCILNVRNISILNFKRFEFNLHQC